ncbi:DUF397 domain-containing protein [Streptomyces sp. NPDC007100]|uniref:DUF397 domain-containing protein n=1 Tax=Streptomyces sp. NPDC007100 TaxID=3155602 RepID=UPI0033F1C1C7
MSTPELAWTKSSHSGSAGGNCSEVAFPWLKSSYSSGDGDSCVEVAASPTTIRIRDSKNVRGPQLAVSVGAWGVFLRHVGGAQPDPIRR